jgi:two-component system KDP operon response regulator KdpE
VSEHGAKILIIDDEPQIRRLLRVSLTAHGYAVSEAPTGQAGIETAALVKPDLILLDLGLPDLDGKAVIRGIRDWSAVPILILTVRDQETEKIDALDAGADDYVTKPFSMGELLARLRVGLRRSLVNNHDPVIICGDLTIDVIHRQVLRRGEEIKLTPTEYDLLKHMAVHVGRVLTHKQLLSTVWGKAYQNDTQYLRVYMGQLRRKIEDNPSQPRFIMTEPGVGYRLMCPTDEHQQKE